MNTDLSSSFESLTHQQRFDHLVVPHLAAARREARRWTGNSADADDVAQEAAVRLLRFLGTYRGGDARAWVVRVARNTALTWLRRNRRPDHHPLPDTPDWEPALVTLPLEDVEALQREIAGLPRNHREVVLLRHVMGLAYGEMATTLNIPVGTVMSRLSRARQALRARL